MYERIKEEQFPKPIKIGQRSVAWVESDIDDWIKEKINYQRGQLDTENTASPSQPIEISVSKAQKNSSAEQPSLMLGSQRKHLKSDGA
jgi:hypothetical protein